MALAPGTRLGPYEITAPLGAGGMGEVYRATDRNLKRPVAIKVLPASMAGDAERLARFQREAEVLAALNHPNIAAIYGVERTADLTALVMELVEGEDLSAHIARGAMPMSDALPIAKQIADALEAAHEAGIVHRDLKPANIKVRTDGTVKVLDFGLAKAMDPAGASSTDAMNSPTLTARATQMGMILGTAAYMAPEQAKGKAVDRRADIWAFGVVLHEMLTGRRLFEAEDVSETLAAVLTRDVTLTPLPPEVPYRLRALVRDCLIRDPKQRLRDIGDARLLLDKLISGTVDEGPATAAGSAVPAASSRTRERVAWGTALLLLALLVAGGVAWLRPPILPQPVSRLTLPLPPGDSVPRLHTRVLALSPDGARVAFVSARDGRPRQIYLRALDSDTADVVPGTEGAESLFFSPNGKMIGFAAGGNLMKVAVDGGVPIPLCAANNPRGAHWGDNGTIVFAPLYGTQGLFQVSETGGTAQPLVSRDVSKGATSGEEAARWPQLLPGGRAVLYTAWSRNVDDSEIVVVRLDTPDTKEQRVIVRGGTSARYVSSGHLIYARGAVLMAVPFDLTRLEVTGEPMAMVSGVSLTSEGGAQFDTSTTGALVYMRGSAEGPAQKLVWVDRSGGNVPLAAPARDYRFPRLSPNGMQVAVTVATEKNDDLAVWDIPTSRLYPLTSGVRSDTPQWTPNGDRVVFRSVRGGIWNLYSTLSNGGGGEERLTTSPDNQIPWGVSPDGQVVFAATANRSRWVLPATGDRTPRPLQGLGSGASFSSDGRWLAYYSAGGGRSEVWVQSFPSGEERRQISTEGGVWPQWARSGSKEELYYWNSGDNTMRAVEMTTQPALEVGKTRVLFEGRYEVASAGFNVTRDGQRFLMLLPAETQGVNQISVVLNWFEELKRRAVPGKAALSLACGANCGDDVAERRIGAATGGVLAAHMAHADDNEVE